MKKNFLEAALQAAEKGFHVFPIVPNTKVPPKDFRFKTEATRDPAQIRKWWTNGYSNHNIGISTSAFKESEALIVVDIDQKDGKMGEDELLRLELQGLVLPPTLETITPSGGRHLFYKTSEPVKQGVNVLAKGIDIRSRGGYVVGPWSVLSNGPYVLVDGSISEAPEWLVSSCGRSPPKPDNGTEPRAFEVNRENAFGRARFYLENEAPLAVQGSRNDTTYKVAARVKDFGVNLHDCSTLMADYYVPRCDSFLGKEELIAVLDSAYKYGEKIQGSDSPEAEFEKIGPEVSPKKTKTLFGERGKDVEPNFNQVYLVDKLLSPNAMSVIYGESNSGKTFFALDLSLHISLGQAWHDKKVLSGLVFYIAAEGGWGIKKRIKAFRKYHNLEGKDFPFVLIPCPVDLLNPKTHVNEIIELISEFQKEYNCSTQLIVVDTLARAMGSGNENAPNDMGAFVKNIDHLRLASNAHVMVIHHSGKDSAKGARGHSSLRAATDTEIEITPSPTNSCNLAKVRKQRDMEFGSDIGFTLKQIEIGKSPEGNAVNSCVVLPANTSALKDFGPQALDPNSLPGKGLKALQDALAWLPQPAPNDLELDEDKMVVSIDEWRDSFCNLAYPGKEKKKSWYTSFTRVMESLEKDGHIKRTEIWAWLD